MGNWALPAGPRLSTDCPATRSHSVGRAWAYLCGSSCINDCSAAGYGQHVTASLAIAVEEAAGPCSLVSDLVQHLLVMNGVLFERG